MLKINRYLFSAFVVIILLSSFSVLAGSTEDSEKEVQGCNGTDPLGGGIMIPKELVMRCGLCSDGKLELTYDCVRRLAYDYKVLPSQYGKERTAIKSAYVGEEFDFAVNRLVTASKHDDKVKNDAGQETASTIGIDGSDKKDNFGKSAAKECQENQNSSRCLMEANSTIGSDNAQVLLNALHTKAIIARSDFVNNLLINVSPNLDVDTSDNNLRLPEKKL